MAELMEKSEVQFFLDNIGQGEFIVIHQKKDGSQGGIVGRLDPSGERNKEQVPVMVDYCERGWKSFNINRVLVIEPVDKAPSLAERIKSGEYA